MDVALTNGNEPDMDSSRIQETNTKLPALRFSDGISYKDSMVKDESGKTPVEDAGKIGNISIDRIMNYAKYLDSHSGMSARELQDSAGYSPFENIGNSYDWKGGRYEKNVSTMSQVRNMDDFLSSQQSAASKIADGVVKAAVLTGTTYLDTKFGWMAGIAWSLGNLGYDLINGKGTSAGKILSDAWNNPVTQAMQKVNDWSERNFANYRSKLEQSRPWWENVFTANFIADDFLKQAGFTIGSNLGLKGTLGILTMADNAISKANIGKVYQGAFMKASKNLGIGTDDLSSMLKMGKVVDASGNDVLNTSEVMKDLMSASRQLKTADFTMKLIGSTFGANSEAAFQAITDSKQYMDLQKGNIAMNYMPKVRHDILSQLYDEHSDWFIPDGKDGSMMLSSEHYDEYNGMVQNKYDEALARMAKDASDAGNADYLMNLAILTASDAIEFGRYYSGGYNTGRLESNIMINDSPAIRNLYEKAAKQGLSLKGGMTAKEVESAIAEDVAKNGVKNLPRNEWKKILADELSQSTLLSPGETIGINKFSRGMKNVMKIAKNGFTEGNEEMLQQSATNAVQYRASQRMNDFCGVTVDPTVNDKCRSLIFSTLKGFKDVYSDPAQWEQFATAGLMGMLGSPGVNSKLDVKSGKAKSRITWAGGIWDDIRDIRNTNKQDNELLSKFKDLFSDDGHKEMWKYFTRMNSYEDGQADALKNEDAKTYNDLDQDKLLSSIILFNNIGRPDKFYDYIGLASNPTEEDFEQIRKEFANKETGKSVYDGMTYSDFRKKMDKWISDYSEKAERYKKIYNNVMEVYAGKLNQDSMEELTWLTMRADESNRRANELKKKIDSSISDLISSTESAITDPLQAMKAALARKTFGISSKDEQMKKAEDGVNKLYDDKIEQLKKLKSSSSEKSAADNKSNGTEDNASGEGLDLGSALENASQDSASQSNDSDIHIDEHGNRVFSDGMPVLDSYLPNGRTSEGNDNEDKTSEPIKESDSPIETTTNTTIDDNGNSTITFNVYQKNEDGTKYVLNQKAGVPFNHDSLSENDRLRIDSNSTLISLSVEKGSRKTFGEIRNSNGDISKVEFINSSNPLGNSSYREFGVKREQKEGKLGKKISEIGEKISDKGKKESDRKTDILIEKLEKQREESLKKVREEVDSYYRGVRTEGFTLSDFTGMNPYEQARYLELSSELQAALSTFMPEDAIKSLSDLHRLADDRNTFVRLLDGYNSNPKKLEDEIKQQKVEAEEDRILGDSISRSEELSSIGTYSEFKSYLDNLQESDSDSLIDNMLSNILEEGSDASSDTKDFARRYLFFKRSVVKVGKLMDKAELSAESKDGEISEKEAITRLLSGLDIEDDGIVNDDKSSLPDFYVKMVEKWRKVVESSLDYLQERLSDTDGTASNSAMDGLASNLFEKTRLTQGEIDTFRKIIRDKDFIENLDSSFSMDDTQVLSDILSRKSAVQSSLDSPEGIKELSEAKARMGRLRRSTLDAISNAIGIETKNASASTIRAKISSLLKILRKSEDKEGSAAKSLSKAYSMILEYRKMVSEEQRVLFSKYGNDSRIDDLRMKALDNMYSAFTRGNILELLGVTGKTSGETVRNTVNDGVLVELDGLSGSETDEESNLNTGSNYGGVKAAIHSDDNSPISNGVNEFTYDKDTHSNERLKYKTIGGVKNAFREMIDYMSSHDVFRFLNGGDFVSYVNSCVKKGKEVDIEYVIDPSFESEYGIKGNPSIFIRLKGLNQIIGVMPGNTNKLYDGNKSYAEFRKQIEKEYDERKGSGEFVSKKFSTTLSDMKYGIVPEAGLDMGFYRISSNEKLKSMLSDFHGRLQDRSALLAYSNASGELCVVKSTSPGSAVPISSLGITLKGNYNKFDSGSTFLLIKIPRSNGRFIVTPIKTISLSSKTALNTGNDLKIDIDSKEFKDSILHDTIIYNLRGCTLELLKKVCNDGHRINYGTINEIIRTFFAISGDSSSVGFSAGGNKNGSSHISAKLFQKADIDSKVNKEENLYNTGVPIGSIALPSRDKVKEIIGRKEVRTITTGFDEDLSNGEEKKEEYFTGMEESTLEKLNPSQLESIDGISEKILGLIVGSNNVSNKRNTTKNVTVSIRLNGGMINDAYSLVDEAVRDSSGNLSVSTVPYNKFAADAGIVLTNIINDEESKGKDVPIIANTGFSVNPYVLNDKKELYLHNDPNGNINRQVAKAKQTLLLDEVAKKKESVPESRMVEPTEDSLIQMPSFDFLSITENGVRVSYVIKEGEGKTLTVSILNPDGASYSKVDDEKSKRILERYNEIISDEGEKIAKEDKKSEPDVIGIPNPNKDEDTSMNPSQVESPQDGSRKSVEDRLKAQDGVTKEDTTPVSKTVDASGINPLFESNSANIGLEVDDFNEEVYDDGTSSDNVSESGLTNDSAVTQTTAKEHKDNGCYI